jgi:hypothetical protein
MKGGLPWGEDLGDVRLLRGESLKGVPNDGPARITEISYGSVKGTLSGSPRAIGEIALLINGEVAAQAAPSEHFELDARRPFMPSHRVEVLVRAASGEPVQLLEWGLHGPDLPVEWRAAQGCRLPCLFLLGAAKSATTSVHIWLDAHPDIFMSRPKEPFFFEAEYGLGPAFYFRKYFSGWAGQHIAGESRHRNLYLPFVPRRIHDFNPDAKLLAVLRNPARRAVSHWWHWRSQNLEPLSLKEALQADLERIEAGKKFESDAEAEAYAKSVYRDYRSPHRTYLDSGYYAEQLRRYIQLFGREKLLVIFFEELVDNPELSMSEIFRFMNVDPSYSSRIGYSILNDGAPGVWEHVEKATETWLIDHYEPHNRRLEELLDRTTPPWATLL